MRVLFSFGIEFKAMMNSVLQNTFQLLCQLNKTKIVFEKMEKKQG